MLISKFLEENTETLVTNLEGKLNVVLPNDYRNFLCRYNGGFTPNTKFRIGKNASDIRGFYGLGYAKLKLSQEELDEFACKGLLPIACDTFGNYIVMSICAENYGQILFFDHETGRESLLCFDFSSFIKKCKSEKINEKCKRSIKEREESMIAKGRGHIITDTLRRTWQAEIDKYGGMIQEEVVIN